MCETLLIDKYTYKGTVSSITPCKRDFKNRTTGETQYCHDVIIEVDGFPGFMFNTQICNKQKGVTDFEVNDYIVFEAGAHFKAEDRYTIKFKNKAYKAPPKTENISGNVPKEEKIEVAEPTERKYESSIAGTPWSICLTAAKDFHKDRKTSNDAQVIATLKAYLKSYNEYLTETDYLSK